MIHSKAQIAAILDSIGDLGGLRVDRSGLGLADPPAFTLGPPSFTWGDYSDTPTTAPSPG